jgi:hypothetical protein
VRYQAALRPDMTSRIDSKVLSNAVTTAHHDFFLNRAKIVPILVIARWPRQNALLLFQQASCQSRSLPAIVNTVGTL